MVTCFETSGLEGLADNPGRGRKPSIPAAKVARHHRVGTAAEGQAPPEHSLNEPPQWHFGEFGAAYLVQERAEAASAEDLQAVE
jgi:hypothetical protein